MLNVNDQNAKQTFASSTVLSLIPNAYAEWNYNAFFQPYVTSSSATKEIISNLNPNLGLYSNLSWTSLNDTTITSAFGRVTEVRKEANCPKFYVSGNGDQITTVPITISQSATSKYYKMVFYLKSETIQTFGTPISIGDYSGVPVSLHPGSPSGSTTWYYRIVTIGSDGESYGLDYSSFSDEIGFSNLSSSQVVLDISTKQDASSYEIYRSLIQNDNNPTYVTTLGSTGNIVTFTDNIVANTNNNNLPASNFTNKIYVNPQIFTYNNSTQVDNSYYVKIFDNNSSENYIPTGTAIVEPSSWKKVEVWFGSNPKLNGRVFNNVKLMLNCYADYQGYSFFADNFEIYDVTEYDYLFNSYYPVDSVFEAGRPGETLLNNLISSTDQSRYINYGSWNQAIKPCSFYSQNPEIIVQNPYPYKQYLPSIYDRFKFYVSEPGLTSIGVQARYDNFLKVNKVVLKANTFFSNTQGVDVIISTGSGDYQIATDELFEEDGTLTLYYDGTSWSKTKWIAPPQLNLDGQIKAYAGTNLYVSVSGIKVQVKGIYPNSDYINVDAQSSTSATSFSLIEVSPRLEVDITPLVLSKSITKEMSQGGTDSFPIGYMSSNNCNIVVSNIPVYYNGQPFTIFENDSAESTFYNLMRQGVKFSCFYTSPLGSFSGVVPAGIFYSDSWQVNDIESVSIGAFDQGKYLMMAMAAPQYSATNASLIEIITDLLNISGFSDYDYDNLVEVLDQKAKINYFWTDEQITLFDALQSLFIAHQISGYFDEYGMLKFISLKSILNKFNASTFSPDFFVGDRSETVAGTAYVSNIIPSTFNETIGPKIGKVIINYRIPNTNFSDYVSDLNSQIGLVSKKRNTVKTIWQEDVENALPCTEISKSMNTYQNYFNFDPSIILKMSRTIANNKGDVFIGSEIISYEGLEYRFFPSNNFNLSINKIITAPSDIDDAIREIKEYISSLGQTFEEIRYYPTGKAVGVMRGKYNTPIQNHYIFDSMAGTANEINGTVNPSGYFKTGNLRIGSNSVSFSDIGQGVAFTYGTARMSSQDINNTVLLSPNELSKNYNYFATTFNSSYRHTDQTQFGLFFNVVNGNTSNAQFLTISRYGKSNTKIELFLGSPSGSATTYANNTKDGLSSQVYSQVVALDLFDGVNHRISVYMSSPYLHVYIDGREISKIQLDSQITSIVPNSVSNFGAFVNCLKTGIASAKLTEIYAANFPVVDELNNQADFRYLPRYHFNTEKYLDNIVHNIQNSIDNYLWQAKPQVRGFKFYDVKHSLSPAIPNTAVLQKVFYGTATANNDLTNIIMGRVDSWNASYSKVAMTPFRSRFVVVNNHNQILWLKAPGDNIGNLTIFPLQIQANYQFLTNQVVLEKIIDRKYANTSIQMTTDWIQGENDAYRILLDSASLLTGFHKEISIQIFGNPLVQVGDFCKLTYSLKRIGTQEPTYYFVKSINQNYNNGLTTQLILKPMIFL
jgi:hypothetical protein